MAAALSQVQGHALLTDGAGELTFVSNDERTAAEESLAARGALIVRVQPAPRDRGHLADAIDAAIEETLSCHDRSGSGMFACDAQRSFADVRLSEHLFRCHRLGFRSLALSLESVSTAATPMGAMESTDSAILRFYAQATRTRPIALLMSAADRTLGAYADPLPLESVLFGAPTSPEPLAEQIAETEHEHESLAEPSPATLAFEAAPVTETASAPPDVSVNVTVSVTMPEPEVTSLPAPAPAPAPETARHGLRRLRSRT